MEKDTHSDPGSPGGRKFGWARLVKCIVAIAAFVVLSAFLSEDAKTLVQRSATKYDASDFDGAIADCNRAIEADPKSRDAYKCRGLSKSRLGDWSGCLADMNAALALAPEDGELLSIRAFTRLRLHDIPSAKADLTAMERLDPKNGLQAKQKMAEELLGQARSESAAGDNAMAIKDLDLVLALFPDTGVAYHERGAARSDLKQYKEAIADFDQAIRYDDWYNQSGDSYLLRAKAKRALGDTAGAEADDEQARKRASK